MLLKEIQRRPAGSFEPLLHAWEKRHGIAAVDPLLEAAADKSRAEDSVRYIALMGAAKLGGKETAPRLVVFLRDGSWMIRSGALRALTALRNPATAAAVLPLLRDPALVVRLEAVEAVEKLQPEGGAEALLATLEHAANYHGGKAQWVPQKALAAIAKLNATKLAPRLKPLLEHESDPELQKRTVATLETLTGKRLKLGAPLVERVREWKVALRPPSP